MTSDRPKEEGRAAQAGRGCSELVDVIVPTRNRAKLTAEAIRSVQDQTAHSWHLIVVDDGSDDGSVSQLRALSADDRRITLIERPVQGGQQAARQTGFTACTAPFVATLDSDDVWEPTKLQKQLSRFIADRERLPRLGAILCGHDWLEIDGTRTGVPRRPKVAGQVGPLGSRNMSTVLATREAVLRAGGYLPAGQRALRTSAGIEFSIRFSQSCEFTAVDEILVHCRHHAGERTSDYFAQPGGGAEDLAYVLEIHSSILERYPRDRARLGARAGARFIGSGRFRTGLSYLLRSIVWGTPSTSLWILWEYGPFTIRSLLTRRARRSEVERQRRREGETMEKAGSGEGS